MRKPFSLVLGASLLVVLGGMWWLQAAPQGNGKAPGDAAIPAPTLTPNLVTVNSPTQVLVTVSIPNPTLNPTTVDLYRVRHDGTSFLVAQMNDTGKNGDQKSGDKTFTALLSLNELAPLSIGFHVSATFRGNDATRSPIQQFAALAPTSVPVVLPPDPGEAGKVTLAGIDSDGDGVRDDVQRHIIFAHPESERFRQALLQIARANRQVLIQSHDKGESIRRMNQYIDAVYCLGYSAGNTDARALERDQLKAELLNTRDRTIAWLTANEHYSGQGGTVKFNPETLRAACVIDPQPLLN